MSKRNSNDLPKICMYCEHCTRINDPSNVLCDRKGIVNAEFCCKKFFYDPLKRIPKPLPPLPKLSKEDFLI